MIRQIVVTACALALLAASAADAARRPRCNLAGPNLAHSRTIKVVKRTTESDVRLLGCVRPNGRIRTLAQGESSFTTESGVELRSVAGTWVVIGAGTSNQYGGGSSVRTVDVRTGRAYGVATESYTIGSPTQGKSAPAVFVNGRGFTSAVLDDLVPAGGTASAISRRAVALFSPSGTTRELDSGPPGELDPRSLILDTRTVLWTRAGLVRYARF
jgi:hypothetical protein